MPGTLAAGEDERIVELDATDSAGNRTSVFMTIARGGGGGNGGGRTKPPETPLGYYDGIDNPFADVKETDWYYDSVMFTYAHGLMVGTSENPMMFSPDAAMTRGMIVTVLYRMAGSPDVSDFANPFDDVATGTWYTDAGKWAAANGIVSRL